MGDDERLGIGSDKAFSGEGIWCREVPPWSGSPISERRRLTGVLSRR